jgi:hypothetical protein
MNRKATGKVVITGGAHGQAHASPQESQQASTTA